MKKDCTEIVFILDQSGSMDMIKSDVIGGFNSFIEEQKKLPGEVFFSLVTFSSRNSRRVFYNRMPIQEVEPLTIKSYCPNGMTALLQAVSQTVDDIGQQLAEKLEEERPERVLMVIMTDGEENDSGSDFPKSLIAEKIKHQTEVYKWEFLFPGANQDSFTEAKSIGIGAVGAYNYKATTHGVSTMFASVSSAATNYRTTGDLGNWKKSQED